MKTKKCYDTDQCFARSCQDCEKPHVPDEQSIKQRNEKILLMSMELKKLNICQ
jgi:hypothetical protein